MQPCLRALEAMTATTRSPDEQAFGISALANARIAPYPERLGKLNLRNGLRIRFAQSLTRLSGAERLALIRPLLGDPDIATQYQAVLILGHSRARGGRGLEGPPGVRAPSAGVADRARAAW